jgi:hypothetical protein
VQALISEGPIRDERADIEHEQLDGASLQPSEAVTQGLALDLDIDPKASADTFPILMVSEEGHHAVGDIYWVGHRRLPRSARA